jgi:hypothetical protein
MHNLFDLWMSNVGYNKFAMIVSSINNSWDPTYLIIGVFEMKNIISVAMENEVKILLHSFDLVDKTIVYDKVEGLNLNTLTNALKFIVSCCPFQLLAPFVRSFWPCNVKAIKVV